MRIQRLDLIACGPFTDASLDLSAGSEGLHIVYGPNEAGKSSALRAIRQLLYGFEERTVDSFLHANDRLRVGAMLSNGDGEPIHVIRRKGRGKTLREADDATVVEPGILSRLLGGVDENEFRTRYGIGHKELTEGGAAIVAGGGDLGSILFASAEGMAELHRVRKAIEDEADALFRPQGRKQKLTQAFDDHQKYKKKIDDASASADKWRGLSDAITSAERDRDEKNCRRAEISTEQQRLNRIQQALPLLVQRTTLEKELAALADAKLLDKTFIQRRLTAMNDRAAAQSAHDSAAKQLVEIAERLSQLEQDSESDRIVQHLDRIEEIVAEFGAYRKNAKDRPGLVAEYEATERDIQNDLKQLDALDSEAALLVTAAAKARIRELSVERRELAAQLPEHERRLATCRTKLAAANERRAELPAPVDVRSLEEAVRRALDQGDLVGRRTKLSREADLAHRQAAAALARLPMWNGSLDELRQASFPTNETIDKFRDLFSQSDGKAKSIDDEIDRQTAELQRFDRELEQLERSQYVPSEQDLEAARVKRQAIWTFVAKQLEGDSIDARELKSTLEEFAGASTLAEAYEQCVVLADDIADRLRREADAVSRRAALLVQQERTKQSLGELQSRRQKISDERDELVCQWADEWKPLDATDRTPPEMRSWIDRQRECVKLADEADGKRNELSRHDETIEGVRRELADRLPLCGDSHLAADEASLAELLQSCRQTIEIESKFDESRRECDAEIARRKEELTEEEPRVAQLRRALETWREQWTQGVDSIGLAPEATPAEAESVLEVIARISEKSREALGVRERVEGIDREQREFEDEVRSLCKTVLAEWSSTSVESVVDELRRRADQAKVNVIKRNGLHDQEKQLEAKRKSAADKLCDADAQLIVLCEEADCKSPDELPEAERRSDLQRTLENEIRQENKQLQLLSAGRPIESLAEEASAIDGDALLGTIAALDEEFKRLEPEIDLLQNEINSRRVELMKMDGGAEAAVARQEAEMTLSRIADDARQWGRLQLASAVLRGAIEEYQKQNEGPLLKLAGEYFAELTLGRFSGLRADHDTNGQPVLVGVADDGSAKSVDQMSDGTSDQLYLALRLAGLEHFFEQHPDQPRIPLIVDDILHRFDDDRSAAALKALARLSQKTQIIFFTHHEHLVRLAEESLHEDQFFTHRLDAQNREPAESGETIAAP